MTDGSSQTVVLTGAAGGIALQKPAAFARSIVFALDRPADVQIAEMMILPVNRY